MRLDGHDPRPQAQEGPRPVTDMSAEIEGQLAGL
jgi:hypothetical protein